MNSPSLKFLVDAGVGNYVEQYLADNRYDMKSIRVIDKFMPDEDIIRLAVAENRMIITMDKDFGELTYHSGLKHNGVLLLRLEDANGTEKVRVVTEILEKYSNQMAHCFCVYQNNKFRIRKINGHDSLNKM